jgi:hypothetical protein
MSNYIEIDKKPVIFDDPEYCNNSAHFCKNLDIDNADCVLFDENIKAIIKEGRIIRRSIKCDECKTAWKAVKKRQSKPCSECDELIGIDPNGTYICLHRHCADHPAY